MFGLQPDEQRDNPKRISKGGTVILSICMVHDAKVKPERGHELLGRQKQQ